MALFTTQGFLISALFLGLAHAGSNSTSGNTTMVGWVSPAPRRSTWDIIWSCLSIFIVCSWKCVHLNIPTHEEIQGEWHTVQICRRLPDISIWPKAPLRRKWRRKILWMTFIALAPEFGVALATRQYMDARRELKEFTKALPDEVAQRYTMIHAFYVQMGGIIIYEPSTESESQSFPTGQKSTRTRHGNRTAKMVRSLSYIQNEMLRVNEHEIKDLSKADVITKAFAIIQCTWLVMQSICRTAQGYTISLLELATLAFIFCAFIMHTFWWAKPFDVESRRIIMAIPPNLKDTASLNTLSMDDLVSLDSVLLRERIKDLSKGSLFNLVFDTLQFANPNAEPQHFTNYLPSISLYIASTTFLAIHLAAWNWLFPSNVVRSLWRWLNVATLVSSFTPFIVFLYGLKPTLNRLHGNIIVLVWVIGALAYFISRLVVLGLTFYCLSSMPESTYATLDWLSWVPHFS